MTIKRTSEDILHFLIKQKQKEWTLNSLSQALLIPKPFINGMIVGLRSQGYIKVRQANNVNYYSLINN